MSQSSSDVISHQEPARRDLANFILFAAINDHGSEKRWEQIWARAHGEGMFEICCIPFFADDLALGDIVTVQPENEKKFVISKVVRRSGGFTFRVWFGETHDVDAQNALLRFAAERAFLFERRSIHLLAMNVPSSTEARIMSDFLEELEKAGRLTYECVPDLPGEP